MAIHTEMSKITYAVYYSFYLLSTAGNVNWSHSLFSFVALNAVPSASIAVIFNASIASSILCALLPPTRHDCNDNFCLRKMATVYRWTLFNCEWPIICKTNKRTRTKRIIRACRTTGRGAMTVGMTFSFSSQVKVSLKNNTRNSQHEHEIIERSENYHRF